MGLRHFGLRRVKYLTHWHGATALSILSCWLRVDGVHPADEVATRVPAGVAKDEIAAQIAMRSLAAHAAGDVSGICRLPNRCPCTGAANTRRAVEWTECRQTSSFSDLANDHPRHLQGC